MRRSVRRLLISSILAAAGWLAPVQACDVPVYRYALEHWNPDAYQAAVIHQGSMDSRSQEVAGALQKQLQGAHANLIVQTIDADHPADEAERTLCQASPCGDGPRIVVRLPAASQTSGVVWDAPLNADATATLADSPCRREIARRLLADDAVIWVLLQSGQREQDDGAADRIEQELKRPTLAGQQSVTCSMVRVSRADPAEKLLVETLLSTEADLRGHDEPMAFPVFGRGRVLYALVGAGINADNVRHTLAFLTDGCSCTVKRENPGVDLLLTADWSVIAPTAPEEAAPQPATVPEYVPLTPLPVKPARPAPSTALAEAAPARGPGFWLSVGVGAAAVLVVAAGWFALRSKKAAS